MFSPNLFYFKSKQPKPSKLKLIMHKANPINKSCIPRIVVVEEATSRSGICQDLFWQLQKSVPDCKTYSMDLGHRFAVQGDMESLYKHYGLDPESIAAYVQEVVRNED